MFPTIEETRQLLGSLSESYAVEVKSWFDPALPEGQAKLVKAMMALRNNGGGRLVVGFDNASMQPAPEGRPSSIREAFDQDEVQALASRFASEPFEILVQYVELGGEQFPVICVPNGVRTPVATKSELKDAPNKRTLVPLHAVYVRTLASNNTVSTATAQWRDWVRLTEVCFDNREADIGRFVRRHMTEDSVSALINAISLTKTARPSAAAIANEFLQSGRLAFERSVSRSRVALPKVGYFELSAVVEGELKTGLAPNASMLNLIGSANRHLTGWPVFVTLNSATIPARRPYVTENAWESTLIRLTGERFTGIDFWRIQPDGKLYAARAFYEDFERSVERGSVLAIVPAIRHVADGFAETIAIAAQMAERPSDASVAISLRWTGLADRTLSNVLSQRFWSFLGGPAVDDVATASAVLPCDLPDSAIVGHVGHALAPLFRTFQGFEIGDNVLDAEVKKVLAGAG